MESTRRILDPEPAQRFADLIRWLTQKDRPALRRWRALQSAPLYLAPLLFPSFKRKLQSVFFQTHNSYKSSAVPPAPAAADMTEASQEAGLSPARRA
jgi:hypothetical protein